MVLELKDRIAHVAPPAGAGAPLPIAGRASARRPALRASEPGLSSAAGRESRRCHADVDGDADLRARAQRRAQGADAVSRMRPPAMQPRRRRVDDDAQYEAGLRPRSLDEYIGQDRVRDNLAGVDCGGARPRRGARSRAALRSARARQDDARLRHRQRDGRAGARDRRARSSRSPATSPRCSPTSSSTKSCSSTRFIACRRRSRRSSIRRWRTTSSTSSSARAPARAR